MEKKFGRIAFVEIAGGPSFADFQKLGTTDGKYQWERIRGLDVKFNVTMPIFSAEAVAEISILGLSMDRIKCIASWGGMATTNSQNWLIRLYAGYGDSEDEIPMIFEGQIINAMPTMPPNVWLNIQARTFFGLRHVVVTKDIVQAINGISRETTLRNYIKAYCDGMHATMRVNDVYDEDLNRVITIPTYDKPTSENEMMKDFSKLCKKNNIVFCSTWTADGKMNLVFYPLLYKPGFNPKNPIEISSKTGMIGIPKMTWAEIEVSKFLDNNSSDRRLTFLSVTSRFAMPGMYDYKGNRNDKMYNAVFRVNLTKYTGHLRGNEWYVTYKAWRIFIKSDTISVKQGAVT